MCGMSDETCARCGANPAAGYATIGEQRYCHGDGQQPTCYMRSSWDETMDRTSTLLDRIQRRP
jgi:hypothetical protein